MKLGVITDGISRDFEHALNVMAEYGLRYPELQFVWDREVGDHDAGQVARIKALLDQHDMEVSCISRHNFGGLPVLQTEIGDTTFEDHVSGLRRCIALAKTLGTNIVRIMSCKKEMILFGYNGAEDWIVTAGAWDKLVKLMAVPVQIAEEEGVTLVVETGNNAMITSGFLARKLIDELGSSHLKLLWDIPNTMYCTDIPFPDAYNEIRDYIGHIHIKDAKADIARATVGFYPLGEGDVAPYLEPIANALKRDGYAGAISYESVYRPEGGTFEDGFRASVAKFVEIFS
ncbi:MAG: sugar phosphate isomerase/epimerase [Gemmatimonadetes bacterium]|nr:sugar phosphate isomerase/epimerase [Gemmatimonadota bacterium]MYD63988.1 sugar phosphate isomerase/epimerase [Gemmatimonadota bacterium]MYF73378.1 sugar phosphate isomerase/epimerase [Gemmatimonadota bacterium]MYK51558.1 sugar phosphate isomerase/epimerase [Gemmatimonadota bacterium]